MAFCHWRFVPRLRSSAHNDGSSIGVSDNNYTWFRFARTKKPTYKQTSLKRANYFPRREKAAKSYEMLRLCSFWCQEKRYWNNKRIQYNINSQSYSHSLTVNRVIQQIRHYSWTAWSDIEVCLEQDCDIELITITINSLYIKATLGNSLIKLTRLDCAELLPKIKPKAWFDSI